jgi:very-long-chain enoyl-CoA reductase
MRPRVHNVLSYTVTLLVFWAVLVFRTREVSLSSQALLAAALWSAHFIRRTLESALVHRYSKPRIGPGDYLTEYVYYWGFAAWIAWSVTAPTQRAPALALQALGLAIFVAAEAGNAQAHRMLRDLRPLGSRDKRIPRGFLFEWVSCPHYLCEILSWVGFNVATQTLAGLSFMLVGAGILGAWAHTRHAAYRQEFSGEGAREAYPVKRRALLPGLF